MPLDYSRPGQPPLSGSTSHFNSCHITPAPTSHFNSCHVNPTTRAHSRHVCQTTHVHSRHAVSVPSPTEHLRPGSPGQFVSLRYYPVPTYLPRQVISLRVIPIHARRVMAIPPPSTSTLPTGQVPSLQHRLVPDKPVPFSAAAFRPRQVRSLLISTFQAVPDYSRPPKSASAHVRLICSTTLYRSLHAPAESVPFRHIFLTCRVCSCPCVTQRCRQDSSLPVLSIPSRQVDALR